jgi:hypothetical protein
MLAGPSSLLPLTIFLSIHSKSVCCVIPPLPQVSAPVEALLDVASHPEDAICSMSFNFWHRLARALTIGLHPEPLGELTPQPLEPLLAALLRVRSLALP